ncbi:MAG: PQQ-binding-like beta-propeller repeat protein [Phycisphaerae bacterium]|nr:PQQ-binding-like beta-propeller repeat protein [Tepidisphaeraceae bacterium]
MTWRTLALAGLFSLPAAATEWPSFRGPNYDGITDEKITWPKGAQPKQLWKVKVGEGFGTMAVAGGKVYVTAGADGQEALLCLDAKDGAHKWHQVIGRTIAEKSGGNGPRTTPTASDGLVYAYGTYFNLIACDAATGKVAWKADVAKEFGDQTGTSGIKQWGNASSPVVDADHVYVAGGGSGKTFVAFDKKSGKVAWASGAEKVTHSSPTLATIHGVPQVVFFVHAGLVSVDAKTGKELWRYAFPFNVSTATTPVVAGDIVYCSAGYKVGAGAARVTKSGDSWKTEELWRIKDEDQANHWTSCVYKDGHLYGIYGFKRHGDAPLRCVELATGKVKWEKKGFGPGGTILAGEDLVVQGDAGQIAIVKASPDKYTEVAAGKFFDNGKCWNAAVVAGGKLYARSAKKGADDQPFIVCLDVSGAK